MGDEYTRYHVAVDPTATNHPHAAAIRLIGTGHRVLEVGCWSGHVTEHLVAAGNRVVGVELDPGAAALARRHAERVHVLDLDVESGRLADVEPDTFDVLYLGDVLEHLRDPAAVLIDLLAALEPGGRVVISVPHVAHVDVRLMLLEGTWDEQDDGLLDRTHLRWFTKAGLRRLLTACGLVATEIERVVVPLGGSLLPLDPALHSADVLAFVEADPEAYTYQFVVAAQRRSEMADPDSLDVLAATPPGRRPQPSVTEVVAELERVVAENEQLRADVATLQGEIDLWRRRPEVRAVAPARRLLARGRRRR